MVEVFKTNVTRKKQCKNVIKLLLAYNPLYKINVDLHDCDKVLRIEAVNVNSKDVIVLLAESGFDCEVLPD
ncbi:MAG: hypothetical protein JWM28_3434 [Chitinophagaceae bacterium]|nr:hypothetical protein [Chitinophagaceae bacterium]